MRNYSPPLRSQIVVYRQRVHNQRDLSWWRKPSPDRQISVFSFKFLNSLLSVLSFRRSWNNNPRWFSGEFVSMFSSCEIMKTPRKSMILNSHLMMFKAPKQFKKKKQCLAHSFLLESLLKHLVSLCFRFLKQKEKFQGFLGSFKSAITIS